MFPLAGRLVRLGWAGGYDVLKFLPRRNATPRIRRSTAVAPGVGTIGRVLTLRVDLPTALSQARAWTVAPMASGWLADAPQGATHRLERVQAMPPGTDLDACGRELLAWGLHRRAGLRVLAEGDAAVGVNVVLEAKFGPVSAVAPCRVTALVEGFERVGFEYATLPGHPELGVERFEFVRDAGGVRFEVRAVSQPAFLGSRVMPFLARRVQERITERYLEAALAVARRD